jgi:hypothetical protein
LETIDSFDLPPHTVGIAFWRDDEELGFALANPDRSSWAGYDVRSRSARGIGYIDGRILTMATASVNAVAFKAFVHKSDVWRYQDGKRISRLTDDGANNNPDMSVRGDLIVEHVDASNSSSLLLYSREGSRHFVTSGRHDLTPAFLPDGSGWLYVDGDARAIKKCQRDRCETLHIASDVPFFPVASPDQQRIAYVTKVDRPRLMILERSGETRDLGPARSDCSPRWSAGDRVWVLQGSDASPRWTEINVNTGASTGHEASTGVARDETHNCPFLTDPPTALHRPGVAAWSWEETDIRTVARN